MESDEDDGQGVYLDPNGYPYRDARQRGFAGDELYFTGYDTGQHRRESYPNAYYGEGESEEDAYYQGGRSAYRGREEALAQSAYERIAKARASGQTNINLSVDEMEALERRRGFQQPAPVHPPPLQIASPPATPVKTSKGKSSSRNNSSASLSSTKGKKKSSSLFGGGGGGGPSTPPSKSKSKSKSSRKMSVSSDQPPPFSPGPPPPQNYIVAGPNGYPIYAPGMPYYPPPSPELSRAHPPTTRDRSRSTSKHTRRGSTPPEPVYAPHQQPQYSPRFYHGPGPSGRPGSSSSSRSYHDDQDWYPPPTPPQAAGRSRAASNAMPPSPAAPGRRSLGSPAEINFAALRRVPPGSSPLAWGDSAAFPGGPGGRMRGSGLREEVGEASEEESSGGGESSEDQGVQVLPEAGRYSTGGGAGGGVGRTVSKGASAGAEVKRRKARR